MPRGAPPSAWIGARPPNKPASGGEAKGRPSSPDSASKSESSAPEGTSSGKEDSNSEKHTSGSEVEQEEVDYGGSSGEAEEQKENQQQGRPLAAQAEEKEGEEEKESKDWSTEEESKDWSTEEEESGEEKEKRIGPPFKPPPTCRIASTACTVEAASASTAKAGLGRRTVFKGGLWRQKKEIGF